MEGNDEAKFLLWDPLPPELNDFLTPGAQVLCQPQQPLAAASSEGRRIHIILHLLHATFKMLRGFVKFTVAKITVKNPKITNFANFKFAEKCEKI